jgi:hypothetical protein
MAETQNDLDHLKPVKPASPPIQRFLKEVLRLEKEHLYEDRPRLKDDIVAVIKQENRDDY